MASPQERETISANYKLLGFDFDPDATTVTDAFSTFQDMRDFSGVIARSFRTVGTGNAGVFTIVGSDQNTSGGNEVTIKTSSTAATQNAVGDELHLEVSAEEFAQEASDSGFALRFVAIRQSLVTATDECVITFLGKSMFPARNLTADNIS